MGEQQINPTTSLDISELDKVTGGIVIHETKATSTTTDARRQEQADKLTASENNAK